MGDITKLRLHNSHTSTPKASLQPTPSSFSADLCKAKQQGFDIYQRDTAADSGSSANSRVASALTSALDKSRL